jgi:hypothetical protein
MRTFLRSERQMSVMTTGTHLYKKQADDVSEWSHNKHQKDWNLEKHNPNEIKHIADHSKKLGVTTLWDNVGGSGSSSSGLQALEEPDADPDDDDGPSKEGQESDDGSTAVGGDRSGSVAPSAVLLAEVDHHGPVIKASPAKSSVARGGGTRGAKAGLPSVPGPSPTKSVVADDSVSVAESAATSEAGKYILSLSLVTAMTSGKLGVQAHHANNLLAKMMAQKEKCERETQHPTDSKTTCVCTTCRTRCIRITS